ncbi:MAG: hypothetical protein EAZ32_15915 [Cytophagia bacterium]|nr:MAG: hypothetical protein EAZ38_16910 [Cytophagales bacterium]TAG37321.1 MAG: hypothetical protein EAZ32_15915 [Cytophagia bacterium]TAG78287.1 MAG: hypothetical protein EAZ22_13980 [Cytophagales bacterium]
MQLWELEYTIRLFEKKEASALFSQGYNVYIAFRPKLEGNETPHLRAKIYNIRDETKGAIHKRK